MSAIPASTLPTLITCISQLMEGEIVSYYCDYKKKDVLGEVIGLMDGAPKTIIIVKCLESELADILDIKETCIYRVGKMSQGHSFPHCECGAKFTSNPTFHLTYCPLTNKVNPPAKW